MKQLDSNKITIIIACIITAFTHLTGCADYHQSGHPVFLKSPDNKPAMNDIIGNWTVDDVAASDVERYSKKHVTESLLTLKENNVFIAEKLPFSPEIGKVKYKSFTGQWKLELRDYGWTVVLQYFENNTRTFHPLYIHGQNPYYLIEYIADPDTPPCIVWSKRKEGQTYTID